MGAVAPRWRRDAPRNPATRYPQTPRTTKREPVARRAFGKKSRAKDEKMQKIRKRRGKSEKGEERRDKR